MFQKIYITFIFSILMIFIINITIGQSLSIDETVNYLNKISIENPSVFKVGSTDYYCTAKQWTEYTLSQDGTFIMESFRSYENCVNWGGKNNIRRESCRKDKFNINDVILSKMRIEDNGCFYIYDKWNNKYWGCNTDDDYIDQKIYNAYNYLFSQVQLSKEYKRNDDDPFSPKNYKPVVKNSNVSSNLSIQLSEMGSVFTLNINIGAKKYSFILDSGAGEMNISNEVEQQLVNEGVIKRTDYLVSGLYRLADGSIVVCRRVMIKKIKIKNSVVSNVIASIGGYNTPLLLGRSFLNKFKKWTIDNNKSQLILEK